MALHTVAGWGEALGTGTAGSLIGAKVATTDVGWLSMGVLTLVDSGKSGVGISSELH